MYSNKIGVNLFITLQWVIYKLGIKSQELEKMNLFTYKFKPLKVLPNP